ncbi:MAG: exo-alpha-sialidase [Gemmatimonadetes bacterium]|nr:exo-alpha-sialidase [Gemmatimonadota bacterium]
MRRLTWGLLICTLACSTSQERFLLGEVELSRPPGTAEPFLGATADGRAVLTWFEPLDADHSAWALRLAVRSDAGWSEPRTVVERREFFVNWADFPSFVELADGSWAVHWLEMLGEGHYAYGVQVALSRDEGRTWSEPIAPHRDDSHQEHGFVSMVPFGPGAMLVWLDGRDMQATDGGQGADAANRGAMSLRATTLAPDGSLGPDLLIDQRTCECCQTALARTTSGVVAAYRDRSEDEIRDIAVVRYVDGTWTEPQHVAADQWQIDGCPVNGPQLSALGDTVAIAWFTGAGASPQVQVAFSTDAGATWSAPVRVDEGAPLGRVDIEMLADGSALLVWLERRAEGTEIRARRVVRSGTVEDPWTLSATDAARASGFPRMTRLGDELVFAWTLAGEQGGVRVASARW